MKLGRFQQALMALQGHGLLVEESDLRRAEKLGDMQRREPARWPRGAAQGGCWLRFQGMGWLMT